MAEQGMAGLALTFLHIVFAGLWLGSLALMALTAGRGGEAFKLAARLGVASLLALGLVGIVNAYMLYGDIGSWFRFGTPTGRVGEKIVTFIVVAALAGYAFHAAEKKPGNARIAAALAFLASLGAVMLGLMLSRGL